MPVTVNSVVLPQTPKVTPQNFVQGTDAAGTLKTLFTAGANGSKITGVIAASNDGSAAHVVTLYLTRSAVDYIINAVSVPASAGGGTNPNIDLLSGGASGLLVGLPVDNDGQKYLLLESGDTLRATFATALTASSRLDLLTIGANF